MKILKRNDKYFALDKNLKPMPGAYLAGSRSYAERFTEEEALVLAKIFGLKILDEKPQWVLQEKGSSPPLFMYSEPNNGVADFYFARPGDFIEKTAKIVSFESKAKAMDFVDTMFKVGVDIIGKVEYIEGLP